jgi:hypothetical protein
MDRVIVLGHVQVMISPQAAVTVAAAIAVLLGAVWLLRGGRAVLRTCAAIGAANLVLGLASGNVLRIGGGLVVIAVAAWALWPWQIGRGRR